MCMSRIVLLLMISARIWAQETTSYPSELPEYRFYATAPWRALVPTKSTMAEVRKALGNPDEASDMEGYGKPYPGDTFAKEPVFTYRRIVPGWEVLVYFTRYCDRKHPRDPNGDHLCSIDLIPKKRISFAAVKFPATFIKRQVTAIDAFWDEYADGTGLRYEVYTAKPQYGGSVAGDLNRISYGPPEKPTSAPEMWWQR
jgi:hypothetical protein